MGVQIPLWEGAIFRGNVMPADLSPLAAANELVRRLRAAVVALSPAPNDWIRRHEVCDAAFRQITLTTCSVQRTFNVW